MDSDEFGLPLQQVDFMPDSFDLITNEEGHFFVNASGSNEYTFILAENPQFPIFTTPNALTFQATEDNWNSNVQFGVSTEFPVGKERVACAEEVCEVFL